MEKVDIKSMDITELQELLQELGEPKFRAKQLFDWLHAKLCRNDESFQEPARKAWRNGGNQRCENRAAAGFAD